LFSLPSELDADLRAGATLLVPSYARARAARLAHAALALKRGQHVWASADVLTPGAWMRREAERGAADAPHPARARLLSPAEEWYLWRECTLEATPDLPLLDASACAAALQRAAQLADEWGIAITAGAGREGALLLAAQSAVQARCRELHALPAAALLSGPVSAARTVRLAGFTAVPPRLKALSAAAVTSMPPPVRATLLTTADHAEEDAHIASWCAAHVRRDGQARLLVLAPGSAGRRERLATLIRQELAPAETFEAAAGEDRWVGVEGMQSVATQPMLAHALTTLAVLAGETLDIGALGAWLRSPFWAHPPAPVRARLMLALRAAALAGASLPELSGALQRVPDELAPAARELTGILGRARAALSPASASARSWAERFQSALTALEWPGTERANAAAQASLLCWHQLLEEFGQLNLTAGSLTRRAAVTLLRELSLRTPALGAADDVSVTVSASLCDPVVHYDGLWVAGLDSQSFPQGAAPDPFVPRAAQLQAGIPAASPAGRLAEARRLLSAWQQAADDLVLSAPLREADLELLPSPLFQEVRRAGSAAGQWLPARLHREQATESLVDSAGLAYRSPAPLPRGVRSVELQNLCPFRAYAELRLGSVRPERIEPGIPAHTRGRLLHSALEHLWQRLRDSAALHALSDSELAVRIAASVARARDELLAPPPPGRRRTRAAAGQLDMFRSIPPVWRRECARAERLITRLCELERTRAPFRVVLIEEGADLTLAGARLRLRIDRVDALEGGGYALLDYKTGRTVVPDWQGERPGQPQLLIYAAALAQDVAALATVNVNVQEMCFEGIARTADLLPGVKALPPGERTAETAWQEQQQRWRGLLERLIGAFLAGDASLDPRPGACLGCHVSDICRLRELPAADAAQEDAHE
jgi:ATP-dependent helicase/nuclease subunit B